jgi:hypothetical protein
MELLCPLSLLALFFLLLSIHALRSRRRWQAVIFGLLALLMVAVGFGLLHSWNRVMIRNYEEFEARKRATSQPEPSISSTQP